MVGIVAVTHSRTLASGLKELVSQMVPGLERIAFVGGTDDPENPIGTDPMQVFSAIGEVAGEDGVLVLMDLGSALLSAETALDFLEPEQRDHIRLSSAPLVEGTLSAAVQAHMGSDLATVAREAEGALGMKIGQLRGAATESPEAGHPAPTGIQLPLSIQNPNGLHARPAARLVNCVGAFSANVVVEKNGELADAGSINQIATLGIRQGDRITLWFDGADAAAAYDAVKALHAAHFGDSIDGSAAVGKVLPRPVRQERREVLTGISVGEGFAVGPALVFAPPPPRVEKTAVADTATELARLRGALDAAIAACRSLQARTEWTAGGREADIFVFHRLLLQDETTVDAANAIIVKQGLCAEYAWKTATDAVAVRYEALADEYQRARAADIYDIQKAVLNRLAEASAPAVEPERPSILIAQDLSPSQAAGLPPEKISGLCLAGGTATSHAAIIAASKGIPAVVGAGGILSAVTDGQIIVVDAEAGRIITAPDGVTVKKYKIKQGKWHTRRDRLRQSGQRPATTTDGVRIGVMANIGGPPDVSRALENGAEGIGLLRTEFLFLNRSDEPGEDEQYEIYRNIAAAMDGRRIVIRTLDIGGDKPVPYLFSEMEKNPFLGLRGIRFTLANREVFLRQLRAILRASVATGIGIMFPMIGALPEFREALRVLDEAKYQLKQSGVAFNGTLPVGLMIEVPSAVVVADQLAEMADFFSIGTNDLSQYVMAADRGNAHVAAIPDPFHPAVLRMIKQASDAAARAGIHVGMCGALAGQPEAAGLLVGLGIGELSMNASSIPAQKAALREISAETARKLAREALSLSSPSEVHELIRSHRSQ
jgi:multiphosphoryl transfer protein